MATFGLFSVTKGGPLQLYQADYMAIADQHVAFFRRTAGSQEPELVCVARLDRGQHIRKVADQ